MSQRKINFFFLQLSENERIFEIGMSVNKLATLYKFIFTYEKKTRST